MPLNAEPGFAISPPTADAVATVGGDVVADPMDSCLSSARQLIETQTPVSAIAGDVPRAKASRDRDQLSGVLNLGDRMENRKRSDLCTTLPSPYT